MHRLSITLAAAAGLLSSTGLARADTVHLTATLSAATEVPAKASGGSGSFDGSLDTTTHVVTYTVTYTGLTGPATMAHFHGPAKPGANAGVLVPMSSPLDSPIKGTATLTDAQQKDIMDGVVYVNVHTSANPGGEIRGQVAVGK